MEEREALLREYAESRLSQREFAGATGIGLSTLQLWLRQADGRHEKRSGRNGQRLVELELPGLAGGASNDGMLYEIEMGQAMRLRVGHGFEDDEVRRLLGIVLEAI